MNKLVRVLLVLALCAVSAYLAYQGFLVPVTKGTFTSAAATSFSVPYNTLMKVKDAAEGNKIVFSSFRTFTIYKNGVAFEPDTWIEVWVHPGDTLRVDGLYVKAFMSFVTLSYPWHLWQSNMWPIILMAVALCLLAWAVVDLIFSRKTIPNTRLGVYAMGCVCGIAAFGILVSAFTMEKSHPYNGQTEISRGEMMDMVYIPYKITSVVHGPGPIELLWPDHKETVNDSRSMVLPQGTVLVTGWTTLDFETSDIVIFHIQTFWTTIGVLLMLGVLFAGALAYVFVTT